VLQGFAATMEVLQAQLRESERASPDLVRICQRQQIELLTSHAYANSQFWRARLEAAAFGRNDNWFTRLPLLSRREAQAADTALLALPAPPDHGGIHNQKTSGSTGTPLNIAKTDLSLLFWNAITLRDSLWHQRALHGKLAVIRVGATPGSGPSWGSAYAGYATGPCVSFDARTEVDTQLDWLQAEQPNVLLTHASNLRALALLSIERNVRLPQLLEARSYSEQLAPDLRERVREAWSVPVSDIYSANEVGYVALQCPVSGLYHVQTEDVLVEVIGDDGHPCGVGESGRVVVTPLHNFAMPLLRYELGDYATVGGLCSCGRTLPTIERVLGRTRNMLRLPGGRAAFPGFPLTVLARLTAIRELKMIQHSLDQIEIELVLSRSLTSEEEATLTDAVCRRLRHQFNIQLTPVAQITRGRSHKREDFECRMN
jgi:phenylacetate-CoA ligase